MIMTKLRPVVQYLGKDLGWSDYLVPQVNNFVDEDNNPSLSYGVLFVFTGYSLTLTKLLYTFMFIIGLISVGILLLCHLV